MALKAVLESLDGLPDAVKAEYTDLGDGTFKLSVEGADALVDTSGLRNTVKTLRDQNKTLAAWSRAFPDKTPEEIAELVRQAESGTDGRPDLKKVRQEAIADEERKRLAAEQERDAARGELKTHRMRQQITKLALENGVMDDRLDDAVDAAMRTHDLDEKGRLVLLDEDGEVDSKTPAQFFTEILKVKKAWLFKAPDASGSGSDGKKPKGGNASTVKSKKDLKTDQEKSDFISKHGRNAYLDLPKE